ncbi:MAG: hypothetical protein PVG48_00740 [Candidatus Bathyarchaeota archaeon]
MKLVVAYGYDSAPIPSPYLFYEKRGGLEPAKARLSSSAATAGDNDNSSL